MIEKRIAISGIVFLLSAYLLSGLTIVQPDEVGVVRRFGAVLHEPWEPGLHWGLPWGIDRVDRIKPNQTRHLERRCREPPGRTPAPRARPHRPTISSPAISTW